MHRGDSKICRPTADRHSTCSVLNKTAPPGLTVRRASGPDFYFCFHARFLIALLPGAHSNVTANRRLCCSVRISVRTARTFRDCEKPAKVPTGSQESDGLPLSK